MPGALRIKSIYGKCRLLTKNKNIMKYISLISLLAVMLLPATANAQTDEINKAIAEISKLLKNEATVSKSDKITGSYTTWGTQENIFVFDDRIEFRRGEELTIFYFSKLDAYSLSNSNTTSGSDTLETSAKIEEFLIKYENSAYGAKLFCNLSFIGRSIWKDKMEKLYTPQLILFEPVAAQYRELTLKPSVSEEQRKYIVQANSFNEQKAYNAAIELYIKATDIDQTSYPAAYYNLALLSATVSKFYEAIYYMKKYLMLVPGAEDARKAQDKIYEWEAVIEKGLYK